MLRYLTNKWLHILLLLLFLSVAVYVSGSNHDLRKRLQYQTFDTYNKIYPREPTNKIAIIDIDEESLAKMGQWPWPRNKMAEMVMTLESLGASVITFDMVFGEPDRTSPKNIAKNLSDEDKYNEIKESLLTLPDNDQIFAEAIKQTGNVITGFAAARQEETLRKPVQSIPPTLLIKNKSDFLKNTFTASGVATNLDVLSSNAAGNGSFIATPDFDGIIREVSLFNVFPQYSENNNRASLYPTLGLEALRVYTDPKARFIIKRNKSKGVFDPDYIIQIGQLEVPVESDSKFWVHYRNIEEDEYISAQRLFDSEQNQSLQKLLKDKLVFIGTSAVGLRDIRSTPLNIFIPGVEVHVNVAEQIIQENYLKRPNAIIGIEAAIIAAAGFLIIMFAPFINVFLLGAFTLVMMAGMFFVSLQAYVNQGLLIDPVYPSVVLFFLFIMSALFSYLRSEVDRKQIRGAFGQYISPEFMQELTENPDKLKLGGEVKDLTVMFTDIRSFTKISEHLSPEELINLMNDFLTPMSDLVMDAHGTIDKYMGDAMMAFWNAPLDDPDHAHKACVTALKMNEALIPVNEAVKARAEEEGREPILLSAGIGINTGPCSVGNMGSKQRFAYSALGDAVNLASRLEGQTKTYGVEMLIGEDTYKLVPDLAFLELDLIKVIGREAPVKVYTLVGDNEFLQTLEFKKWQTAHNGMLAAYRVQDFDCAAQDCNDAMIAAEGRLNKFYELYLKRIAKFTKKPPPKNWDGIFVAESK